VQFIEVLGINYLAWGLLAIACVLPMLALWYFQLRGQHLFPPQRQRLIPWGGVEIALAFFLSHFFLLALVNDLLIRSNILAHIYGSGSARSCISASQGLAASLLSLSSLPASLGSAAEWASLIEEIRLYDGDKRAISVTVLAFPLQIVSICLLLRGVSGTRLYQLGLRCRGAARGILVGWLGWLLLAPVVLIVHVFVVWVYWFAVQVQPETHPIALLSQGELQAIDWFLILFSSVIAAPAFEELFFRGVLQPYFSRNSWGGEAAMGLAFVMALATRLGKLEPAWMNRQYAAFLYELQPAFFVLAMLPLFYAAPYLARGWVPNSQVVRAIFGTSLLFAMFHANIWPTPIPLFLLALGLGYLAYRMQNLTAPIVLHSLFNGVACMTFVLSRIGLTPM
jgi:membrane protease YdiL (CAAX protease family)